MGSFERYLNNQVGQSPEDYQGAVMGADSGDPCDMCSAYFDPNYCQAYGYQPYDSGCGASQGPGNPYGAPQQGTAPVDWSFCEGLVVPTFSFKAPLHVPGPQGDQLYRSQMEGFYNQLNSYVEKRMLITPRGNVAVPFRFFQVGQTGDPYNDFYTDETHHFLLFADTASAEWINAGLDQYCPSYVSGPTGQCQDIPGYQCQMSGQDIMMGEDFVLMGAAPVVHHLAKQASASPPKGKVVWRKMTMSERAAQRARYQAGGKTTDPQKKVPLSSVAKVSLAKRNLTSAMAKGGRQSPSARNVPRKARIAARANQPGVAVNGWGWHGWGKPTPKKKKQACPLGRLGDGGCIEFLDP